MSRNTNICSDISGIAEQIRRDLKIGQKVKTNRVPWTSGQGKPDYEHKTRAGKVIAKYPYFFVVQFPQYRECFKYTDVVSDIIQICDETEEELDDFNWLGNLKEW